MRATCPAHFVLLDLIIPIIFDEDGDDDDNNSVIYLLANLTAQRPITK
jgi:hypothetical protein